MDHPEVTKIIALLPGKLSRIHRHSPTSTLSDTQPESACLSCCLTVNRGYPVYLSGLGWSDFLKPDDETKHILLIWQFLRLERGRA